MGRWLLFLNSLLLVGISYVGYKIFLFWNTPDEKIIPEVSNVKPVKSSEIPFSSGINKPLNSYDIILAKNLFRPDRREPKKEVEKVVEAPKKKEEEKIFLHGIISLGSYKIALLRDELGKDISRQRQNRFKKGDPFNDYIVKEILEDRVVLKGELEEKEILLHDLENPKARARIEPRPQPQLSMAKLSSLGQKYQQTPPGAQQSQAITHQQSLVYIPQPTPFFQQTPPSPSGATSSQPPGVTNPFIAILQEAAKRARGEIPPIQPPPSAPAQGGVNPFRDALLGQGRK